MSTFDPTQGVQSVYNFWLGLIPQFMGQFGGAPLPGGPAATNAPPASNGLLFPADQIAKAAAMTQQSLQSLAQWFAPMLQAPGTTGGTPQWPTAMSPAAWMQAAQLAQPGTLGAVGAAMPDLSAAQAFMAPWTALMKNASGIPSPSTNTSGSALPLQAMSQAWLGAGSKLAGTTPADLTTAFDRTYGALTDALGLGPLRQLQAAWQEVAAASLAQQEARANYALIVQRAFAQGLEGLMKRLADKAASGERIDSILALLRLWAVSTEEAVHQTLQSDAGLAATAGLARSALAYRKKMQQVAAILADMLDIATRRDLDEAYRAIQELKREVRTLRAAHEPHRAAKATRARKAGDAK
jgi:hypothetical protein